MNDLTETLLKTYKARLAVVVYTPESDRWNECYLESHEINDNGQLLEGKPLKQETIEGMVDVLFDERKSRSEIKGLLPENVLKFEILPGGYYQYMWFRPQEKRQIHFSKSLHIKSGIAWMPAMVYSVVRNNLEVFALDNDSRPTESSQLFHAPFHNVNDVGGVCLGSAKVKKPSHKTFENVMKYWEDLFWLSEFSHLQQDRNPTKTNLTTLWRKLVGTELTWSEMDELQEMKKLTLAKLI